MPYFCRKDASTMLDHIHIENYRLFKELDIPKVGQVNLITGKNNSGKTTLLEALRILVNNTPRTQPNSLDIFDLIIQERGEKDAYDNIFEAFKRLYYKWERISPHKTNSIIINDLKVNIDPSQELTLSINERDIAKKNISTSFSRYDRSIYIPANFNLTNARLWKNIELTDKEDKVAEILRIIEPTIVRVSINERDESAKVRLANAPKPLPLKNFGEGMNRLLTIALGLVSAENNLLVIDEIDLGLHHSIQSLLWEIVFQKAKELNVQVFATTHSSDCVQAFSFIANKPEYAGLGNYIRLQRSKKDSGIIAVDYDMEQLENSLDLNLETR